MLDEFGAVDAVWRGDRRWEADVATVRTGDVEGLAMAMGAWLLLVVAVVEAAATEVALVVLVVAAGSGFSE